MPNLLRMILNKNVFFIYFSILLSVSSFGQEIVRSSIDSTYTEELDEVIVTATRTTRQLSSLPLPAHIVTNKEIKNINSLRLSDIINEQTGLTIVQDHGDGVQMQGLDSDYTLVLIDGAPLIGRTAGTLDLSRVTVGNIQQIEIVKGATSSLYGSEALAGVINIITKNPQQGFGGNLGYRYGTLNSHDISTTLNYKKNKLGISGFANGNSTDGYDLNESDDLQTVDPYHNYTFNLKVGYDFSENTSLSLSGRYFTENQDYIPTEDLAGKNRINEWNAHLKFNEKFNEKWNGYLDFYTTRYKTDSYLNYTEDDSYYSDSFFDQIMLRPEVRIAFEPSKNHSFIAGVGWTHESLDRTDFSNKPIFDAPYVYLQYDSKPIENLNVILGARFDAHNKYESQFSPKAALRYEITDEIAIKGSVGYGYKAPDFRQLYLDFTNSTVGYTVIGYNRVPNVIEELEEAGQITTIVAPVTEFNGNLKAENSLGFNLGIQYKPSTSLSFEINAFRNNIHDLIDTQVIATKTNGQNVYSYININEVYTQGVEINTTYRPSRNLTLSAGYQLLYAKDKSAVNAFENGEIFARLNTGSPSFHLQKEDYFGLYNRSRHMANGKVFYNHPKSKIDANLRITYRSKYGIYDTNNNNYLDDYDSFVDGFAICDLAMNKTFSEHLRLGFGVDNLFDFTDSDYITSIPGRLIYVKLNINF